MTSLGTPLVSVGIPAYNNPAGLKKTLQCITAQTYTNLEIIVSIDGPNIHAVETVAREFQKNDSRVTIFTHEENKGGFYKG